MLRTKKADRIVCVATVVMLLISVCLWGMVEPVRGSGSHTVGYESLLFDQSTVHTIDITMDTWDDFIQNATAEEYTECRMVIDGEPFSHVAIRAKGNTSLSSVASLGSTRYSFKVEFDHFMKGMTYHGLDKLSLNNLIQDATMMKDYLAYTLMNRMDVPASLCSYVQITVNGEPWGLYLAVEGVEDAFMDRNGITKGELYKPDSMSFGGGRGNGRNFDFEQFRVKDEETADASPDAETTPAPASEQSGDGASFGGSSGEQAPQGGFAPSGGGTQQGTENLPDFSASDGNSASPAPDTSAQPDQTPQGGFAPSGGSAQQGTENLPDFSALGGNIASPAPDNGGSFQPPDFGGDRPEGGPGGGFGGFNFGMGSEDVKLIYSDDNPDSYSNIFNNAKTKIKTRDKTRLIEALRKLNAKEDLEKTVNQDEVIRYLAVHNFLCNDDSYTGMMVHNYYLYEEKGRLSIIPWDYNLGFGGFSAGSDATSTVNSPMDSPVSGGTVESRPLIAWIFSDENALNAYHEAYSRFLAENIENGWLEWEISRVQTLITPYLEKDQSAFYDMEAFEKAVATLRTFCEKRALSLRGQLEGTIPSTSSGQRNSDALIDASEISTADMGSMNTGNGAQGSFQMPGGMPGNADFPGSSQGFTPPSGFSPPDTEQDDSFGGSAGDSGASASEPPQTEPAPDGGAAGAPLQQAPTDRPDPPASGMRFPGAQQNRSGLWLQTGLCAALLLLAILIVRRVSAHNQ